MNRAKLLIVFFVAVAGLTLAAPLISKVSADGTCSPATGDCKKAAPACQPSSFLGLKPWYNYLQIKYTINGTLSECDVEFTLLKNGTQASSLPLIMLAVLDDLIRIAGFAAVAYVIWGGVKYITSQGSPDGTKQAQNTVLNAVIGLIIAIISTAVVSFIGRKIAGG